MIIRAKLQYFILFHAYTLLLKSVSGKRRLVIMRTRIELTTLFLQTTKRKKGEATISRFGLEDQRWSTVVRSTVEYVCVVVVVCAEEACCKASSAILARSCQ
ncbi:conserved hypothetical protein [Trichinella spiralis]|uniref:hypothetical protein n=1 Tax=Trichinella spiralis TaxID=6334 RepID=UPI0001EFBF2B|nr:conserved hypothetical protein [Trichinella spiralis]